MNKSWSGLNCRSKATIVPYFVTWFLKQHCLCSLYHKVSDEINYFMWMGAKGGSHHAMPFPLLSSPYTYMHSHTYYSFPSTKSKSTSVHKLIQIDALRDPQPSLSANSQTLIIKILQEDSMRISIILFN